MPFTNALCFFLSKQASFYIIFVVVVVFVRLSFSFFSGDCRYTRKTSARAARGIARENEARDYSARLLLHALFAFARPIIAKK